MCGPQIAIAAASMVMGAIAAKKQSDAAKDQAQYQAAVANNNQIVAERDAVEIEKAGQLEANKYRQNIRQIAAQQTLSLVAQGGDVTDGSAIDLLADTAELGELDAQVIVNNSQRNAYKSRVQGVNYGAQAGLFNAKADAQDSSLAVGTSLLSGASNVAKVWAASP